MEEKKKISNNGVHIATLKRGIFQYEYVPLLDIKISEDKPLRQYFNEQEEIIKKLIANNKALEDSVKDLSIKLNALQQATKDSFNEVISEIKKNEFL